MASTFYFPIFKLLFNFQGFPTPQLDPKTGQRASKRQSVKDGVVRENGSGQSESLMCFRKPRNYREAKKGARQRLKCFPGRNVSAAIR